MTKLYKLTDAQGRTRAGEDNELTWAVGVTHKTAGTGTRLCSSDVIHAYEHPLLTVLLNPIHAMLNPWQMRLFLADGEIVARDNWHCGVHALTILEEIPVPELSLEFRIGLAIWAANHTSADASWHSWADDWLNNRERSKKYSGKHTPATMLATEAVNWFNVWSLDTSEDRLEPDAWPVSAAFFTAQAVAEALSQSGFNAVQIVDALLMATPVSTLSETEPPSKCVTHGLPQGRNHGAQHT